jgi:hypothetical protein
MTTCDKCGHGVALDRCANRACDPWEYLANHKTGEQFLRRKIGGKWLWVLDTGRQQ